jgi:ABC-type sugar transport system ATPase subunit
MQLEQGALVALIGSNGAGTTTPRRAITGLSPAAADEIWLFDGRQIGHERPERIVALGISMVPEGRRVYPFVSVRDNLLMGAYLRADQVASRPTSSRCSRAFRAQQALPAAGQDASEVAYPCGAWATRALRALIDGQSVSCRQTDTDRYGRIVAVRHRGEVDLNAAMAREGWAVAFVEYATDHVAEEAQATARNLERQIRRACGVPQGRATRGRTGQPSAA